MLSLDAALVTGDLRAPHTTERAAAAAVEAHGRLDGLVVVSGVVAFGPVGDLPDEVLVDLFLVNTRAPVRLLRAVLPHLVASVGDGRSPVVVHLSALVAEHRTGLAPPRWNGTAAAPPASTPTMSQRTRSLPCSTTNATCPAAPFG